MKSMMKNDLKILVTENTKDIVTLDARFRYMMLDRLRSDCEYFLGYGNRCEKHLWSGNVVDHIADMKSIFSTFSEKEKPEWLTYADILAFEKRMLE